MRLLEYLATPEAWAAVGDGKPLLPVRWKDGDALSKHWPADIGKVLGQAVKRFCHSDVETADDAEYALHHCRVVLILDALD